MKARGSMQTWMAKARWDVHACPTCSLADLPWSAPVLRKNLEKPTEQQLLEHASQLTHVKSPQNDNPH